MKIFIIMRTGPELEHAEGYFLNPNNAYDHLLELIKEENIAIDEDNKDHPLFGPHGHWGMVNDQYVFSDGTDRLRVISVEVE